MSRGKSGVVLALVFGVGLLVVPAAAVALAALAGRALAGAQGPLLPLATRYSFTPVPMGFGMWAAHYGLHFLTGGLGVVPVMQEFLVHFGPSGLGSPAWGLGPLVPASWLLPIEVLCLEAGLLGSLVVGYRTALELNGSPGRARRAFAPWALLAALLFGLGLWLMFQPMEMRGTLRAAAAHP